MERHQRSRSKHDDSLTTHDFVFAELDTCSCSEVGTAELVGQQKNSQVTKMSIEFQTIPSYHLLGGSNINVHFPSESPVFVLKHSMF